MNVKMNKGTIKFFNSEKGYGFVKAEDNKEYFVHITEVLSKEGLREGDLVTFELKEGKRGVNAVQVEKIN